MCRSYPKVRSYRKVYRTTWRVTPISSGAWKRTFRTDFIPQATYGDSSDWAAFFSVARYVRSGPTSGYSCHMNAEHIFSGKRVSVLGLGLLGRGVGDVEFLAKCGAEVLVTDKKSDGELAESVAKLKKYPNVTFRLGGHQKEDFEKCDLVIKSAGVRLDSPEIVAARAAGVPVAMSTALFAKYAAESGVKIVGVTGTRGKTTVSHMIYHSLIRANKHTVLGGNVRGVSTLAMLPNIKKGDIAVLELDSWQLQGFAALKISTN